MAVNSSSTVNVTIQTTGNVVVSEPPFANYNVPAAAFPQINLPMSVGGGVAGFNFVYVGSGTVTSGSAVTIDLTTGLTCPGGTSFVATEIIGFMVSAAPANTGNLLVGDAASNAWSAFLGATGVMTLLPGFTNILFGSVANGSGYTVDSSHKAVKIDASAGTQTYYLWLLAH